MTDNFLSELVGYCAASLTTLAFLPQAWLTWKRKRAEGVSLGMYCMMVTGVSCWLAYGLLLHAMPIIIANGITLLLALFILFMKIRYK